MSKTKRCTFVVLCKNNTVIQINLEAQDVEAANRAPCSRNIFAVKKKMYYPNNRYRKKKKNIWKSPTSSIIKILSKPEIKRTFLKLIETTYEKYAGNIMLNTGKLKVFPVRRYEARLCPLSNLFWHCPGISCSTVKQKLRKEIKGTQIVKEGMKLSVFHSDMIIYMETSKNW